MADDLSLLLRIRGDASSGKAAVAEARAAVGKLRQLLGPELTQTVSGTNKIFSEISDNLNVFVGQRLPLVGGTFLRVTENLKGFGSEAAKQEKAIEGIANSITDLSKSTGRSVPELTSFLTTFAKIEGQANRDAAAVKFFGAEVVASNTKLIPEVERTAEALSEVAVSSEVAGADIASLAGPIGIAVVALTALALGAIVAGKELFELSKSAAEFQGKMFDLAQQTGVSVETLSALEITAKTTGGEIGNITQSLVNFQRKLEDAQDPTSKTAELFKTLGVNTSDTESALRSAFTALAKMPEGFHQTDAAAQLFGARGGKQILAILKETNGDLDAALKRFKDLGILISTDDARAADKFNDELTILELQLRASAAVAAKDLIPAFVEIVKALGSLVTAGRPFINLLGQVGGPIVRSAADALRGLGVVVSVLTGDYVALAAAAKEAHEQLHPPPIPEQVTKGPQPIPLPGAPTASQTAEQVAQQADIVLAAAKRSAAQANQVLSTSFEQGRINREKEVNSTIAFNKKVLDADKARIDALIDQKVTELKALDRDNETQKDQIKKATDDIVKLQQDRLDKENEFEIVSRALRAKAAKERADSTRNQIANETDLLVKKFDNQINAINAAIKSGVPDESQQLTVIEQLERAKIDARIESVQRQKSIGLLSLEDQKALDNQIQQLQQEADHLDDEQKARRLAREQETAARVREIQIQNIDALLQLQQIAGERIINTQKALADARVISEEEAARKILQIRLDLIDQEIEATNAKLKSASALTDVKERTSAETELNNQLRILSEQRKTIQADGNRDIEKGRQEDLQNERKYASELIEIRGRVADIQRETDQAIIDLMVLHHARRSEIIKAQSDLDIEDENKRHSNALASIAAQKAENESSKRTQEEKLEQEKALNEEEEAEQTRHAVTLEELKKRRDEALRDTGLEGGFFKGLDTGQLASFSDGIKSFSDAAVVALSAVGAAVNGIANGIGSLVEQWVLVGETGPHAMRKLTASVLAGLAAQAAVEAIFELAKGFAALFFNPAEAAAHFTAAALFGSVAGVAAVAGRQLAGDLFKPQKASSGAGAQGTGQINPLTLGRNQPTQIVRHEHVLTVRVDDSKFGQAVSAHFVKEFRNSGPVRELILNDGGV